jgi:U11/U12 small nuclear ribonucleoprotein SNRNP25
VYQNTSVCELKRKLRDKVKIPRASFKYIWKRYCLIFENNQLLNDKQAMSQLGIKQHATLYFSRLSFQKGNHQKAWKFYRNN